MTTLESPNAALNLSGIHPRGSKDAVVLSSHRARAARFGVFFRAPGFEPRDFEGWTNSTPIWWFQPTTLKNMSQSKMGRSFPKFRGEHSKNMWSCHHLGYIGVTIYLLRLRDPKLWIVSVATLMPRYTWTWEITELTPINGCLRAVQQKSPGCSAVWLLFGDLQTMGPQDLYV